MDWFKYPLHGVACRPWSLAHEFEHELTVLERAGLEASGQLIWSGSQKGERYSTKVDLYRDGEAHILDINCQGQGLFRLEGNQFEIDWHNAGTPASHYFQSMGLALWLELRGTVCLHGNALTREERTVVLVAPSGTGKSTMSSALMQDGFELLTDDMVALYESAIGSDNKAAYQVYPSWPVMRLWPDSIEHVLDANEHVKHTNVHENFDKKLVSIERQHTLSEKKQLTDIILLNRVDTVTRDDNKNDINVRTLSGVEAVMALLKNTILGEVYRPLKIEDLRLQRLAEITQHIRVSELTYPSGTHGLQAAVKWFVR